MAEEVLDYLVVGAGPAGLQLGQFLGRAGHRYLVLEGGSAPGHFFETFPRHRTLISINKKHTGYTDPELNLRMDWNSILADGDADPLLFTDYSEKLFPDAEDLLRYLADYAAKHEVEVRYGTRVTRIRREQEIFVLTAGDAEYRAHRLIMATGVTKPHIPQFPGVELIDQYVDVDVDPKSFTGRRVLVLGKGNSAFETADNLIETAAVVHVGGPRPVKLAWRTHFVGHLRAYNAGILDMYQLKLQHAILDGDVREIRQDDDGYHVKFAFARADEVFKEVRYDRVICCTGFRFDASLFDDDCRPELTINDRFPAQTPSWESVNVPGLYFAGTITQVRDFKKATSAFIHGFRYGARALVKILGERYHDVPWPHAELPAKPDALTDAVITRINRTSALYQQFGFLADVVVVDGDTARYFEEVPVDRVLQDPPDDAFAVTLDYGPDHDKVDPFDFVARAAQDKANDHGEGHYLHPIVRHYRRGELVATHHVTENLENEWDKEVHVEPLTAFFTREL
ncbi:pyridine nucleotide-disulfide oxidoreductase [Amycolatopsis balhimycina DSM 5908]|uniref:Pyridine nucleotide-disulfide oxidoreductase n=1 Tax=Amycolatopsis balhimycina DSM 5908 TaxID=1081091 RepID=A0A428W9U5_AMYBA|nr:NAD(P)-binding domain-containing protein [Amycolatopsis balhimycina]RSM39833.1 pyridine nucleotide-disulfide oxidoreductase [Amycolatopsis balhimycina DSM 5908]